MEQSTTGVRSKHRDRTEASNGDEIPETYSKTGLKGMPSGPGPRGYIHDSLSH